MKRQSANPNTNSLPRCSHVFPSGRRCRSTAPGTDSPFCHRHRPKEDPAAELVRNLPEFHSVADVTVFLSRLIFALSKDQISTRRASVLSYVAVSLMHGFRSLQQEHQAERGELRFDPLPWTWQMPRPGVPDFVDIHDARALYAQQYADDMRKKAEESLAQSGQKSYYYPYHRFGKERLDLADDKPMTEEEAIASYNRLRT